MKIELNDLTTKGVQVNKIENDSNFPNSCYYYNTDIWREELKKDLEDFPDELENILNKWKDEEYIPEEVESNLTEKELKIQTQENTLSDFMMARMRINTLAELPDKEASTIPLMYPDWNSFEDRYEFKKDERICYNEQLYKCLQAHDKQINREPDKAVSLWVIAYTEEYPEWKQPTGAHDAYNIGDKVTYQGNKYVSLINGNTTVPGTDDRYWKLVTS